MISSFFQKLDDIFIAVARIPWLLKLFIVTTLFVLYIPLHHLFDPRMYTNDLRSSHFFDKQLYNNLLLNAHILAAMPAILFGPFLLHRPLVQNFPKLHRNLGKAYIFGCWISAITVVPLALNNNPSTIAPLGFTTMAICWFMMAYFAYTAIKNKNLIAHRRWIIRSYAMTFAFIHVNFTYKLFLPVDALSDTSIKAFQSTISWQANLLIAELYLAATTHNGKFIGFKKWKKKIFHYAKEDKFYLKP